MAYVQIAFILYRTYFFRDHGVAQLLFKISAMSQMDTLLSHEAMGEEFFNGSEATASDASRSNSHPRASYRGAIEISSKSNAHGLGGPE